MNDQPPPLPAHLPRFCAHLSQRWAAFAIMRRDLAKLGHPDIAISEQPSAPRCVVLLADVPCRGTLWIGYEWTPEQAAVAYYRLRHPQIAACWPADVTVDTPRRISLPRTAIAWPTPARRAGEQR